MPGGAFRVHLSSLFGPGAPLARASPPSEPRPWPWPLSPTLRPSLSRSSLMLTFDVSTSSPHSAPPNPQTALNSAPPFNLPLSPDAAPPPPPPRCPPPLKPRGTNPCPPVALPGRRSLARQRPTAAPDCHFFSPPLPAPTAPEPCIVFLPPQGMNSPPQCLLHVLARACHHHTTPRLPRRAPVSEGRAAVPRHFSIARPLPTSRHNIFGPPPRPLSTRSETRRDSLACLHFAQE